MTGLASPRSYRHRPVIRPGAEWRQWHLPTTRPILVVDDDAKIVSLVRMYLEREGYEVIEARDGRAALAAVARHDPLLVILDLMLPEIDGLVGAACGPPPDRGAGGDPLGARDGAGSDRGPRRAAPTTMSRSPSRPAELVLRVQRVLARTSAESDAGRAPRPPLRLGDLELDRQRHEATIDGRVVPLTTAEFRLLTALLEADGRVLSRDQLLDALHGLGERDVLDRAIDAHIRRLRDKLGDSAEQPRYVATVRGVGYRAARAES